MIDQSNAGKGLLWAVKGGLWEKVFCWCVSLRLNSHIVQGSLQSSSLAFGKRSHSAEAT